MGPGAYGQNRPKLFNAEGICSLEKYAKVKKLLEASGELYF